MEIIWKLFPNPSFTVSLPNVPHPVWGAVDPHCSEEFKLLANFYLLPDPEDHQGHSSSFTNLVVLLFHFCYLEMIILWMNPETSLNLKKKKSFCDWSSWRRCGNSKHSSQYHFDYFPLPFWMWGTLWSCYLLWLYSVIGVEVSSVLKCQKPIKNLYKSPQASGEGWEAEHKVPLFLSLLSDFLCSWIWGTFNIFCCWKPYP